MNNEINKKIIYIFKNIIYNLYLLIKSELYYLLESIYDYKNVINNIKETYRNKIYSWFIFYFLTLILIITIIKMKFELVIIITSYFIIKLIIHILRNKYLNINDLTNLILKYIITNIKDNLKLLFYLIIIYIIIKFIFWILIFSVRINYKNLLLVMIIIIWIILFIKNLINWNYSNWIKIINKWKYKINKIRLSLSERRQIRYNKKRLNCYNKIKKQWIKWTKIFYECKWILVCSRCWNTGIVRCLKCNKVNNKRKKSWRCSYCGEYLNRIICGNNKCSAIQYLK